MDLLSNYQGFRRCEVILVFDAYKVPRDLGEVVKYHNIYVVYTKEAETADAYIEKTTYELGKKHRVRVATSDGAEYHHPGPWGPAPVGRRLQGGGGTGGGADLRRPGPEQPPGEVPDGGVRPAPGGRAAGRRAGRRLNAARSQTGAAKPRRSFCAVCR